MKKVFLIHTDGGARGNPGPAAIGVYITDDVGGEVVKFGKRIGESTNNQAEYLAVIEALKWIKEKAKEGRPDLNFFLDSLLVVNQLKGLFKIKNAILRDFFVQVKKMEKEIGGKISFQAINRNKNKTADFLVNQALDFSLNTSKK